MTKIFTKNSLVYILKSEMQYDFTVLYSHFYNKLNVYSDGYLMLNHIFVLKSFII